MSKNAISAVAEVRLQLDTINEPDYPAPIYGGLLQCAWRRQDPTSWTG